MLKSRIQYILTWVSLGLLLLAGLALMALSWNRTVTGSGHPAVMILLWCCLSASGIYLFILAVRTAQRQWIQEARRSKQAARTALEVPHRTRPSSREDKGLDFAATAHKLVRRFPEEASLEEGGEKLLKNLVRELELMSGILYIRKRTKFEAAATYALASAGEPFTFKEGEGLTGQAAKNGQIMVLTRLPEGHLEVYSGLGKAAPVYLAIVPLVKGERTVAVLECAGYRYDPGEIESMFRILARELMQKLTKEKA
jgi:hypothetical protein